MYLIFQNYENFHCFDDNSIQVMFRIHFQSACLLKADFLIRSHHLWIHNLCDLVVILNFLGYQYWEGLIEFLQLIVPR